MIAPDRSFPNGSPVCDYWLTRCEGFVVRAGHRTLGVVETVAHDGSRAESVVLRKGHRRRRALHADDVLAVVPARKVLIARRRRHAAPAIRRATTVTKSGASSIALALRTFTLWLAATVRREAPRLVELLLAEIHDRNAHHGDEPGVGKAHRRANGYRFAAQQPLGRARNVGPTRMR